jgi:general secretion pathway protein G
MAPASCPRCHAGVADPDAFCPHCGFAPEGRRAARSGFPTWAWVLCGLAVLGPALLIALGIAAAIVVPKIEQRLETERQHHARSIVRALDQALKEYCLQNAGRFPETLDELATPDASGHAYIDRAVPLDPWGRAYVYVPPSGAEPRPHVSTLGRDGRRGGEAPDADIDNWSLAEERSADGGR